MADVTVNKEITLSPELIEAIKQKEELTLFYQLGYLDAWCVANDIRISGKNLRGENRETILFKRISLKCKERFEARFFKGIAKQIKKIKVN